MANFKIGCVFFFVWFCLCFKNIDMQCNIENRFGPNCEFVCHCINREQCDVKTGDCLVGCDFEWVGPGCQRRNILFNQTGLIVKHASNINPGQYSSLAIDRNLSSCSYTQYANVSYNIPWWRVWLPDSHRIRNITILTKEGFLGYFNNFKVMVENVTSQNRERNKPVDPQICYIHNNTAPSLNKFEVSCNSLIVGNQIRVELAEKKTQLVLCDVRIYGECENSTYGSTCVNKCSKHCRDECDKDTGYCTSCEPGWTGHLCDKECYENTPNQYSGVRNTTVEGFKCQRWIDYSPQEHSVFSDAKFPERSATKAANYCRDPNETKAPYCFTLEPNIRWQYCGIDVCESECSNGKFGENCSQSCNQKCKNGVCSKLNGVCSEGCVLGYWGHYCKDTCIKGTFGQSCINSCSRYCKTDLECRNTDGFCVGGCKAGYLGNTCVDACEDGKYGENCLEDCSPFCKDNSTCRKTDGICDKGCSAGYIEDRCDKTCSDGKYGAECKYNCSAFCMHGKLPYCSNVNGSCLHGCLAGWHGMRCDEKCDQGTNGYNCSLDCSSHCFNESVCMHTNGVCLNGCDPGWIGDTCDTGLIVGHCLHDL